MAQKLMVLAAGGGSIPLAHHRVHIPFSVVLFSIGGAASYAMASALQHQAAADQPAELSIHASLLVRLARKPRWLLGNVADGGGYLLQFLALRRGSQALVQPLLLCGLVFALPLGAVIEHRTLTRREVLGALVVVVGITMFLLAARPGPGTTNASLTVWATVTLVISVVVGAATLLAQQWSRRRPIGLGLGAGVLYGYTSAVSERTGRLLDHGVVAVLSSWSPYALVAAAVVGMLLAQSAFQAGDLRLSLPTLTVAEPLAAIAIGRIVFGEHLASGGVAPLVEVVGLAIMTAGVFLAARDPDASMREDSSSAGSG